MGTQQLDDSLANRLIESSETRNGLATQILNTLNNLLEKLPQQAPSIVQPEQAVIIEGSGEAETNDTQRRRQIFTIILQAIGLFCTLGGSLAGIIGLLNLLAPNIFKDKWANILLAGAVLLAISVGFLICFLRYLQRRDYIDRWYP